MSCPDKRVRVSLQGVVQGVGLRPYIFDLATRHGLSGYVVNNSDGVLLEVQGNEGAVDSFLTTLPRLLPPLAFLVDMRVDPIPVEACPGRMEIRASQVGAWRNVLIAPDVATCNDCLRELRDPADRRYRYPFINCTNCGPRYTIIDDVPYDRPLTSMARFEMCDACRGEYENPRDRRFHAQPNACPRCGPKAWLCLPDGATIACADPIAEAARRLARGAIVAIKGLGGFHLAVDARNDAAVRALRTRKHREEKPLAVMCRDLDEVRRLAEIDDHAQALLSSRHRPIVLLPKQPDYDLAESVAPGNTLVGVMLPYTPLHALLLDDAPASLVMTSGNVSEEPVATGNQEALDRLGTIADVFLMHDRDILVRNDDSVVAVDGGKATFFRRSRGYVPLPIVLSRSGPCVLAVGADLKNTICLTRGSMAFVSQHVGDQANLAAYESFQDTITRLKRILGVEPTRVAADLNPDSMPSQWAEACGLPLVRVQHHHAHVAACLAEHRYEADALGLALDGVGFGEDGSVWGGELLVANQTRFRRIGHLDQVRLPGGDQAARQPWRSAISHLIHTYGDAWESHMPAPLRPIDASKRRAIAELVRTGAGSPWTSSAGRLFDAVSSLCGLVHENSFEARAAVALEMAAWRAPDLADAYIWTPHLRGNLIVLDPSQIVEQVVHDLTAGVDTASIAGRFHGGFATGWTKACVIARRQSGLSTVALSGGCLQNRLLMRLLAEMLAAAGFDLLLHQKVPPNDGGLSLGQAVVALHS